MSAQISGRFGEGWDVAAMIAAAAFGPFVIVLVGWIVDHLLTWSASQRRANELAWHEGRWLGSSSWAKRRLTQMDGDAFAASERRQLATTFLLSVAIALFGPLLLISPWLTLAPLGIAAFSLHWAWFG